MAAMASKFNFECVIQYYTDQWGKPIGKIHFHYLRVRSASLTDVRIATKTMAFEHFEARK